MPDEISNPPPCITQLQNFQSSIPITPPTIEEIKTAINAMKNNKSTTDIRAELLKSSTSSQPFMDLLTYHIS